jgi:hypothetical protein
MIFLASQMRNKILRAINAIREIKNFMTNGILPKNDSKKQSILYP